MGRKSKKIQTACIVCKKPIQLNPSQLKRGRKCCSKKCMGIFSRKPLVLNRICIVCGEKFKSFPNTIKKGHAKYCSRKCQNIGMSKGGAISTYGYKLVKSIHPRSNNCNYIFEHILIVEKHLNRFLNETETIHHINGIKHDNRLENLYLFKTRGEHTSYHRNLQLNKIIPICKTNLIH
jgi:hypothetical protein